MPASDASQVKEKIRYPRSAHATIRGYLYQTCLGVLRWLDLQPNESLLCEGDQDLDHFLLNGRLVSEQVKAYSGGLSLSHKAVLDSLRSFLQSYVTLRRRGETRSFIFTTTAHPSRQRGTGLDFDLLEQWRSGNRSPEVLEAARALLIGKDPKDSKDGKDTIKEDVAWLNGQEDGWRSFLDAVEWSFDAPNLDTIRQEIRNRLAAREDTRPFPTGTFLERLIVRVLDASIQEDPGRRTLTKDDLTDLLVAARTDHTDWAIGPQAEQIRSVLYDIYKIEDLLTEGTEPLGTPSPGNLLTARYEVIPFDEDARQEDLTFLTSWCASSDPYNSNRPRVVLYTGEGGSGKTRLLIELCRRLRHQGWHAGFLRRDRGAGEDKKDIDPLLKGTTPRLVVVDYAEARLAVTVSLLYKAGVEEGVEPKVRIILLARREEDLWKKLNEYDAAIKDLLSRSEKPRILNALIKNIGDQIRAFHIALDSFALAMGLDSPPHLELNEENVKSILHVHMSALSALHPTPDESTRDALAEILIHEQHFWERLAEEQFPRDASLASFLKACMVKMVTVVTLLGGVASKEHASTILRRVFAPFQGRPDIPETLISLLRRLYGSSEKAEPFLSPLRPDILGERLVEEQFTDDKHLLGLILSGANSAELEAATDLLKRLQQHCPDAAKWLLEVQEKRDQLLVEAFPESVKT